jgi:hypothetical protein
MDIFIHNRETGKNRRASVDSNRIQGNDVSEFTSISADGRYVAFNSLATNLVTGDTNAAMDVFVHGPELTLEADPLLDSAGQTLTFTTYKGVPGNGASLWAVAVNGSPTFFLVFIGAFASDGNFVLSGTVPSGLGGVDVTFRGLAIGRSSFVVKTNDVTVSFQ